MEYKLISYRSPVMRVSGVNAMQTRRNNIHYAWYIARRSRDKVEVQWEKARKMFFSKKF
jgi:hypothetical protein